MQSSSAAESRSLRILFGLSGDVLLGVTGGIASYKSAWLARLLTKAGAAVDVVMTPAATEFVGAITFEALTGRPVHTGLFDPGRALDHIKLARARDGDRRRAGDGRLSRASGDRSGGRSADGVSARRDAVPCCSCRR